MPNPVLLMEILCMISPQESSRSRNNIRLDSLGLNWDLHVQSIMVTGVVSLLDDPSSELMMLGAQSGEESAKVPLPALTRIECSLQDRPLFQEAFHRAPAILVAALLVPFSAHQHQPLENAKDTSAKLLFMPTESMKS